MPRDSCLLGKRRLSDNAVTRSVQVEALFKPGYSPVCTQASSQRQVTLTPNDRHPP